MGMKTLTLNYIHNSHIQEGDFLNLNNLKTDVYCVHSKIDWHSFNIVKPLWFWAE